MSCFSGLQWLLGYFLKYSILYGTTVALIVSTILTYVENSQLQKDRNCQRHLLTNVPQLILLTIACINLVVGYFLSDFADKLIEGASA